MQVRQVLVYTALLSLTIYILVLLGTGWRVGDTLYRDMPIGNALYQLDTMGKFCYSLCVWTDYLNCVTLASIAIGLAWIAHPKWLLHRQVFFLHNS